MHMKVGCFSSKIITGGQVYVSLLFQILIPNIDKLTYINRQSMLKLNKTEQFTSQAGG